MKKIFILLFTGLFFISYGEPEIVIKDPWIRAVPPNIKTSALYMIIENQGNEDEYLIGVETDLAKKADIHTTMHEKGMMKMKHMKKLKIPSGSVVKLTPGRHHIMLMGLKKALLPGKKVNITLLFQKSGRKKITAKVKME
ncbi:copper chaperone PCu(A)C [Persephonella sp.]